MTFFSSCIFKQSESVIHASPFQQLKPSEQPRPLNLFFVSGWSILTFWTCQTHLQFCKNSSSSDTGSSSGTTGLELASPKITVDESFIFMIFGPNNLVKIMNEKLLLYTLHATNTGGNVPPSNYPFVWVYLLFNYGELFIISPFRMKIIILWQKALPPSLAFNPIFSHYQTQNSECWLQWCWWQIHYGDICVGDF